MQQLGPYRLDAELGSGAMGTVYAATMVDGIGGLDVGSEVALKVVHPHLVGTDDYAARFRREAEIGLAVRHPNVVRTLDWGAIGVDGRVHLYLAMERVDGQTLADLLDELVRVPEELCRHVGHEIAAGLSAIHAAGAVHRDLKPENVLITPDHTVKVMDLGVARLTDDAVKLSQTGMFVGSLQYAAPEQLTDGGKHIDGRLDLHALGLVLYELASGVSPFVAADVPGILRHVLHTAPRRLGELDPQLSPFFEELVDTLLAKSPDERVSDARELCSILESGEAGAWWQERERAIRAATRRPLRRMRVRRETALHGRDAELAQLHRLWDRAAAGEGGVLLLHGEAGIGKSRLVDEFVGRLESDGADVAFLFGGYQPGGAATAESGFAEAFATQFGDAGCASYLAAAPSVVPAFDALLRAEPPPPGAPVLERDAIATCFVHATRALAEELPTIVMIDDLHFAPQEGRALFAALTMAVPGHRVLLIGTARPGLPEDWLSSLSSRPQVEQLTLARLGAADLARMLDDAFGSMSMAERLGTRIARKSDGNPFFAFEIVRVLRESGLLRQRADGSWTTTRAVDDLEIPSSVLDLVNARVSELDEEQRDLLDVAACVGFEFDPLLVGEVVGLRRIPLLKRLGHIERRHRLVRSVGVRYVFDHHQVQEALYGSISELLRREYHAAIGEVLLERLDEDDDDGLRVEACEHLLLGGRGVAALVHLDRALAHLSGSQANARAAALLERALDADGLLVGSDRARRLVDHADRLTVLGETDRVEAALSEALALADSAHDRAITARVVSRLASLRHRRGDLESATAAATRVIDGDLAGLDDDATSRALAAAAHIGLTQGRFDDANGFAERMRDLARAQGDAAAESSALSMIGIYHYRRGEFEVATSRWEEAIAASESTGDRGRAATLTGNIGAAAYSQGRLDEAERRVRRYLTVAREIGDRLGQAKAAGNLGSLHRDRGEHQEAIQYHQVQRDLYREMGNAAGEAHACRSLANDFMHGGDAERAAELYHECIAFARGAGDLGAEAAATGDLAGAERSQGRVLESRRLRERQLEISRQMGDRNLESVALVNYGLLLAELGDPAAGLERLNESLAIAGELGDRRVQGYGHENVAQVRRRTGDSAGAIEAIRRSIELRREIGYATALPRSLAFLATRLLELGRPDEAVAPLQEAIALAGDDVPAELTVLLALAERRHRDAVVAAEALADAEPHLRRRVHHAVWACTGDAAEFELARSAALQELAALPDEVRAAAVEFHVERRALLG